MNDDVIPVMRIADTLLVTLQGDLDDAAVIRIENQLTHEVARTGAAGMLIDVSGLTAVDSFVARVLARIVGMIQLLGAQPPWWAFNPRWPSHSLSSVFRWGT